MGGGHEMFIWNGGGTPDDHQKWGGCTQVPPKMGGGPMRGRRPPEKGYPPLRVFFAPSLRRRFPGNGLTFGRRGPKYQIISGKSAKISQKIWNLPKSAPISHNQPNSAKIIQKIQNMPNFSKFSQNLPNSAKLSQNLPKSSEIRQNLPKSAKICRNLPKSAEIYQK